MSFRSHFVLVAAGAAMVATPALAQTANTDVQCLLASNVFAAQEKDPAKKQMAVGASFFYLGRLNPKTAQAQLKAQIAAQGKTLTPQNAGRIMTACAREIGAKQMMMQAVGKELQASPPAK